MPLSWIDWPTVVAWRKRAFAKHKRRFANDVVSVLYRMIGAGMDLGLMEANPAARINTVRKLTGERHRKGRTGGARTPASWRTCTAPSVPAKGKNP